MKSYFEVGRTRGSLLKLLVIKYSFFEQKAACCPATRPITKHSVIAHADKRDTPCTPPVTSPAANKPEITSPLQFNTWLCVLIRTPPKLK